MSVPTGSDASSDAEVSSHKPTDSDDQTTPADASDTALPGRSVDATDSSDSVLETATDWARHWKAWSLLAFSLAVVGWAAFLQPEASPKGYVPIFLGFAAIAVGYVYLDEESQIRLSSG
jgi:hypothetical protein